MVYITFQRPLVGGKWYENGLKKSIPCQKNDLGGNKFASVVCWAFYYCLFVIRSCHEHFGGALCLPVQ